MDSTFCDNQFPGSGTNAFQFSIALTVFSYILAVYALLLSTIIFQLEPIKAIVSYKVEFDRLHGTIKHYGFSALLNTVQNVYIYILYIYVTKICFTN